MTAPGSITLAFNQPGEFTASAAAEAYLIARGFSFAPMQAGEPRGVLWGRPRLVAKWRSLTDAHRAVLDGQITGDPRTGPITVTIFARAPAAAREAVSRNRAA